MNFIYWYWLLLALTVFIVEILLFHEIVAVLAVIILGLAVFTWLINHSFTFSAFIVVDVLFLICVLFIGFRLFRAMFKQKIQSSGR